MLSTYGTHSASELGKELGLSPKRIGDALEELHAAGAVRVGGRGAGQRRHLIWTARPPAEVLAALRRQRLKLTQPTPEGARDQSLDEVLDHLRLLRGPDVKYLASRALTTDRLEELDAVERHEHLAMNPERVFDEAAVRRASVGASARLSRGVRVRVIGRLSLDGDPEDIPPGKEYRELQAVPRKLFVIDRRIALIPLDPRNHDRGYLETPRTSVIESLVAEFERCWAVGRDPAKRAAPAPMLSERERQLIALLAQGHTDASAARRLHISERSVTNILRLLMDRLAAENRFQLGLKLGAMKAASPPSQASS
jgi:DNA-binding CsgD family transcriptional regulator